MTYKRILVSALSVFIILLALGGCNNKVDETGINEHTVLNEANKKADQVYNSAEEFEDALNRGDNVTGAMVTFNSGIISPGPDGYYMYAGKKLAFISSDYPNISPGSRVTVKIKTYKKAEGTWNIEYER